MPPVDFLALLKTVLPLVIEAGNKILPFDQSGAYCIREKSDGTPVTDADQAAHDCLAAGLAQLTPMIPFISEESPTAPTENHPLYWCADPLDGTKEFIRGTHGEYTVNVALIWKGVPILGVIYVPRQSTIFYAASGQGAFRLLISDPSAEPVRIHTRKFPTQNRIWLVSRTYNPETVAPLQRAWNFTLLPMSSSLKHCYIAEGKGDLYLRQGPTGQWDTAATQCLLEEAGGKVIDLSTGNTLRYEAMRAENPPLAICGDRELDLSMFFG